MGFIQLPSGISSFDRSQSNEAEINSFLPLAVFISWTFFSNIGVIALPWMLLSEVFPFKYVKSTIFYTIRTNVDTFFSNRSRGVATGLAAATNYILAFAATKSYYNLETTLSMPGVSLLYGIIGFLG